MGGASGRLAARAAAGFAALNSPQSATGQSPPVVRQGNGRRADNGPGHGHPMRLTPVRGSKRFRISGSRVYFKENQQALRGLEPHLDQTKLSREERLRLICDLYETIPTSRFDSILVEVNLAASSVDRKI